MEEIKKEISSVVGYKIANADFSGCNGFIFKIGETYTHEGKTELCKSGFHFCTNLIDCLDYISHLNEPTRFLQVTASTEVIAREWKSKELIGGHTIMSGKYVTNKLTVDKELDANDVADLLKLSRECSYKRYKLLFHCVKWNKLDFANRIWDISSEKARYDLLEMARFFNKHHLPFFEELLKNAKYQHIMRKLSANADNWFLTHVHVT